jgi:hypothetical protein
MKTRPLLTFPVALLFATNTDLFAQAKTPDKSGYVLEQDA